MNRFFKSLLLWLMMAALPLQGVAAVVKASCGSKHHAMLAAGTPDHRHDQENAVPHHHHDEESRASAAAHGHTGSAPDGDTPAKASTCSACAACCVGAAAPPSNLPAAPAITASASMLVPPSVAFAGHIPAGLERPPRYPLA